MIAHHGPAAPAGAPGRGAPEPRKKKTGTLVLHSTQRGWGVMLKRLTVFAPLVALVLALSAGAAGAAGPEPWQMGFQAAASPVAERIHEFHALLFVIITLITLLVTGLLIYVIFRFNEKRNPVPSRTTHHTVLEVIWTAIPVLVLVIIAVPSFKLLYYMDRTHEADMTLKVTGHQWYWTYAYPDQGDFVFDSLLLPDEDLKKAGDKRLLAVDNKVVLPVDTNIRLLMSSEDVIHNWAVPAFGIKLDTVPGRINETWVRITREGTYYGQCSELCGVNHGFMPIVVEAVSKDAFQAWVAKAKQEFAASDDTPLPIRQARNDAR